MKTNNLIGAFAVAGIALLVSCSKDDNPKPSLTAVDFTGNIHENALVGELIGTIDFDASDDVTFSISNQSLEGAVTIDATSGNITVANVSYFDYEVNQVITGQINVTMGNLSEVISFTVDIDDAIRVEDFVGSGSMGYDEGTGSDASFNSPYAIATDDNGNFYVSDFQNHVIRKITSAGVVSTFAGSGTLGFTDGTGSSAVFYAPADVAIDGSGNLYVADFMNHAIRKITPEGVVTTLAGNGSSGSADGTGANARFYHPMGVAVDGDGNVYVADRYNQLIRKVTPEGVVTTLAGTGSEGTEDGTGTAASFTNPFKLDVDGSGNVYVATGGHTIRKITAEGVVTTFAGSGLEGSSDGTGISASFSYPHGIFVASDGNIYFADQFNHKIRKITMSGEVTTVAGTGDSGSTNGFIDEAKFNYMSDVVMDSNGDLFVVDKNNNKIRKILR